MFTTDFEKISPALAKLTVSATKEELEKKLKSELTKAQRTAQLKGFRKGKVPMATMYKLFANQAMARFIEEGVDSQINDYIRDNKLKLLFSPMPAEGEEQLAMDAKTIRDFSLVFDLPLLPDIQIEMPSEAFETYEVLPKAEDIDSEIERVRKELGEHIEITEGDSIGDDDLLGVRLTELKDGVALEQGVVNEVKILVSSLTEEVKTQLLGQPVGCSITVEITALEKDSSEKHVRNFLLEIEEDTTFEPTFELNVLSIHRHPMADLDQEFFTKFDPEGEIKDEAGLRSHFEKSFTGYFAVEAANMLRYNIQQKLTDTIEIPLDETYLQRIYTGKAEKYEDFLRSVRWMVIQSNFMQQHSIQVSEASINQVIKRRVAKMFGGSYPQWLQDEMLEMFKKNMLERESTRGEILEEALLDDVLDKMVELSTLSTKQVDAATFNEVITVFNAQFAGSDEEEE